ncbi:interferon regulatory factor 9 isoform X1 [Synchiropus splendidus]|uniref:interferon regulatory factor 9 isoform X1 n=1 Tax=Synchiropus splendidus TaxID=270530 RepID=UPI00237DAD3B|nr:interferon regulatory factor 9 isoform X1 [Synchiropus splendidus]
MAGRIRSTRRLRSWMVEQVNSGRFLGVMWDDEDKTMFRIPWKHAGKQDFRQDEDAAIFKAWAQFKGKLTDEDRNPATCKTRLRCALNKSPEFCEVPDRAQLDISEPYKVYRLVPLSEQGLQPRKQDQQKPLKRSKRRVSGSEVSEDKKVKTEEEVPTPDQSGVESSLRIEDPAQSEDADSVQGQSEEMKEIQVDLRIEESVAAPPGDLDLLNVKIYYLGQEVLQTQIHGGNLRILYLPTPLIPPTLAAVRDRFTPVPLPEPPPELKLGPETQALRDLLPFMEKGVMLTSTDQGVYGSRSCSGRVFWAGHSLTAEPHKLERKVRPVLLFSKEAFKDELDRFCSSGGVTDPPRCSITLCFGEELRSTDDLAKKLIIVQVGVSWAEQQLRDTCSVLGTISFLQTLAGQSPQGEVTLDLVSVTPDSDS